MSSFLIVGLILHTAAMAAPAVPCDDRRLNRAVNLLNALALVFGLAFSLNLLLTSRLWEARWPLISSYLVFRQPGASIRKYCLQQERSASRNENRFRRLMFHS